MIFNEFNSIYLLLKFQSPLTMRCDLLEKLTQCVITVSRISFSQEKNGGKRLEINGGRTFLVYVMPRPIWREPLFLKCFPRGNVRLTSRFSSLQRPPIIYSKGRAPIYIKSHGRMIPRFRAGSKKCARFYPWPHKTELHSTCHANWFPCSPFTILFDPRDSRSCSSATLVFFSCARFRVVCRKTIEKQRERERENIDSQIVISIYCGFLCKCNFFFLPFFFFFVNISEEVEYK